MAPIAEPWDKRIILGGIIYHLLSHDMLDDAA
jgi:hypothetical protein